MDTDSTNTRTTAKKTTSATRSKWPRVRQVTNRDGKNWMVDARIAGKGPRYFFKTAFEADSEAAKLRVQKENNGSESITIPTKLRIEAQECQGRLAKVGATITDAVDFFLLHNFPAKPITIEELTKTFLQQKKDLGCRSEYLRIQGHVLGKFAKHFAGRSAQTISKAEILEWFKSQSWAPRTRNNYQIDLANLFGYALREKHVGVNPLATVEKVLFDEPEIGILTVAEAGNLLNAAEGYSNGMFLPYVAIGLFCGARASELRRLDWSNVVFDQKLEDCHVEIGADKTKGRVRRTVSMPANLRAWLEPFRKTDGLILQTGNFAKQWKKLRTRAGLIPWPHNAMRHSFGSYHCAFHKNAALTSLEMGHDNPQELFDSYRRLVKPNAAASYWQLAPATLSNVIPMVG